MKKLLGTFRRGDKKSHFFKQCPNGGICFNPLCMFGCVDDRVKPEQTK